MLPYGIPRRKGRYDHLADDEFPSIEPNSRIELVLTTIAYMVFKPFLTIAGWLIKYVKSCHTDAYLHIKQMNLREYKNRKR